MKIETTAVFAVPYIHNLDEEEEVFFVTFKTKDEDAARILSRCICGSPSAVVVLDKDGFVW